MRFATTRKEVFTREGNRELETEKAHIALMFIVTGLAEYR